MLVLEYCSDTAPAAGKQAALPIHCLGAGEEKWPRAELDCMYSTQTPQSVNWFHWTAVQRKVGHRLRVSVVEVVGQETGDMFDII